LSFSDAKIQLFSQKHGKKMQGRQNDDPAAIKTNKKKPIISLLCIARLWFLALAVRFFSFYFAIVGKIIVFLQIIFKIYLP
jgi:hypothetical protein